MPRYRKKPIVVEAFQMTEERYLEVYNWSSRDIYDDWPEWLMCARNLPGGSLGSVFPRGAEVVVQTLEGRVPIRYDDYIIQGIHGELYPCKSVLFEATYEAVEGEG